MKYARIAFFLFLFFVSSAKAQYFFGEQGPNFYQNGVRVASVVCGDTITFDVPGVSPKSDGTRKVWLLQYKTKLGGGSDSLVKTFNGPFDIPMSVYQTKCKSDEGTFHNYIHEAVKSGDTFKDGYLVIGYTDFSIGSAKEPRESKLEKDEDGIFSIKVSRGDPAISSGYFYAGAVIDKFLENYSDDMDVIVIVPTDSLLNSVDKSSLCDCALRWRSPASGIGFYPLARIIPYDGPGRFFNVVQAPWINEFVNGRKTLGETLWVLSHEIGHGWSAYYGEENGMLDELKSHWARTFSHKNSIMGRGSGVSDVGGGKFEWSQSPVEERVFNDFDLYNMGLLRADQVKDSFSLINPVQISDTQYSGEKRAISIGSLLGLIGVRDPLQNFSAFNQSSNLRATFLIVQGPTGTEEELRTVQGKVKEVSSNFVGKWSSATRNLSSVSIFSPSPKISNKTPSSLFLSFLKDALFPKVFSASYEENNLKEIISNIEFTLRNPHDDQIQKKDFEAKKLNFTGDDRLQEAEKFSPDTSLAPLSFKKQSSVQISKYGISSFSVSERLKSLLARLSVIQTELSNLLKRRAELLGR